jgi:hypothetical protein
MSTWYCSLVLLGVALVLYFPATVGATARQGCVELFVWRPGRHQPVAVAALGLAILVAWVLRVFLGLPFGQRRGLVLACSPRLFKRRLELLDPLRLGCDGAVLFAQLLLEVSHSLAEAGDNRPQFGDTLLQVHATLLAGRWALSGGWSRDPRGLPGQNALSKYCSRSKCHRFWLQERWVKWICLHPA